MALGILWYEAAGCFIMVAACIGGSLWLLIAKEDLFTTTIPIVSSGKFEGGEATAAVNTTTAAAVTTGVLLPLLRDDRMRLIPRDDQTQDYNNNNSSGSDDGRDIINHNDDQRRCWRSCWKCLEGHPLWLLLFRLVALASLLTFISWDTYKYGLLVFLYYSDRWTFVLVILYFILGIMMSLHGCWIKLRKVQLDIERGNVLLERNMKDNKSHRNLKYNGTGKVTKLLGSVMQIVYQASAGAVMLTDVVFWCLIVPFLSLDHFKLNLLTGCIHSVNLVFLLFDTTLNCMPFPFFRIAYFILWTCAYVIFQWVLHACGFSWWPYPFLDLRIHWAPLCYLCIGLIHIPCYGVYYMMLKAKDSLFFRLSPESYIRSNRDL